MKDFLFVFTDYLKGKPIYPVIRRALNLILNFSVASALYEKIIGQYKWIEITAYQSILDFFIKGYFVVPLSIYVFTYGIIGFSAYLIYNFRLDFLKHKKVAALMEHKFEKEEFDEKLIDLSKKLSRFTPRTFSKEDIIEFYKKYISNLSGPDILEIKKLIQNQKNNLSNHFYLAYRLFIAICFYYFFGNILSGTIFWTLAIILLILIFLLIKAFRLIDVLPAVHEFFNRQVREL